MLADKAFFENLYKKYNNRSYAFSDPISLVYNYEKNHLDAEIAGLIASSLAYGNVKQILKSLGKVFLVMGKSPRLYLEKKKNHEIAKDFLSFKHRFTTGGELTVFLINIKKVLIKYGTLENLFVKNIREEEKNYIGCLYRFVNELNYSACAPTLTPCPEKKSSFKRFNLYLRWMIRKDKIDLGVWKNISPKGLIIPLDTHMLSISQKLGITKRKDGSMKTAEEITSFFRKINPQDPVKYDFSITRTGILKNFK
ncbi:MAG: TIGR02757 family protein [Elusimicrobia bacterium]|nr:TIGR02757 family protein [Elusimicrobiota bacterium]